MVCNTTEECRDVHVSAQMAVGPIFLCHCTPEDDITYKEKNSEEVIKKWEINFVAVEEFQMMNYELFFNADGLYDKH